MKVTIKYFRFQHQFGRVVAFCQLFNEAGEQVMQDNTLSIALTQVAAAGAEIINAQEILDIMVRQNGLGV